MSGARLTRREFGRLLGASALATWPGAGPAEGGAPQYRPAAEGPTLRVALVPCPDYGPETLAAAVREGWRSSRPPEVRGKRVVLKPNMVDVSADRPIHTDPRLLEALVLLLGDLGAREIVLAEGTSHNRDSEDLFRRSGYEALARRRGVRLVDLNYDDIRRVPCADPRATLLKEIALPETIASAEVLVSVPKMKTHKLAGITLSMKNMFGVLPGMVYGWRSWARPRRPASWSWATTRWPWTPRRPGSWDALAVDATAARVMGVDPAHVDYLAMAHRIKLGSLRREDIAVTVGRLDRARTDFALDPEYALLRAREG
ncbi:MAG: DUF362 domain-containing protein [Acidobacteria bacterium]|nr:DUF362 domain-containing protein [Acidobacteriota bacterium]